MKKPKNFARFYALLKQMPAEAKEGLKETLVASFTNNRTTSLKDMSLKEYKAMCDKMVGEIYQDKPGQSDPDLKAKRSAVLVRLQRLGINTGTWDEVDEFCRQSRIAGKNFRELTKEELVDLVPKLEAIARKPKRTQQPKQTPSAPPVDIIPDWQIQLMFQYIDKSILN